MVIDFSNNAYSICFSAIAILSLVKFCFIILMNYNKNKTNEYTKIPPKWGILLIINKYPPKWGCHVFLKNYIFVLIKKHIPMKIQNRILWVVALMYMGSFTLPAEVTPASLEQCLYKPSIGTAEKAILSERWGRKYLYKMHKKPMILPVGGVNGHRNVESRKQRDNCNAC